MWPAAIKIQCKTNYVPVCRLTMADYNTLDKQLQLKTLTLQKGFVVANSGCKDGNVTITQLNFFVIL